MSRDFLSFRGHIGAWFKETGKLFSDKRIYNAMDC